MQCLTPYLLSRACRTFLTLAYPDGAQTIPATRAPFLHIDDSTVLASLLIPPICQTISKNGQVRGYAFRLGCAHYPHLKLQVVNCDQTDLCVFAVDTHDSIRIDATLPDAARYAELQTKNRKLKEAIEHTWEASGLLTFNALLRRGLDPPDTCLAGTAAPQPGSS